MGDNFLKRQARNFKKGRDRAIAEQRQSVLFSRRDIITTEYTIRPEAGCALQNGEGLLAVLREDGRQVALARGHTQVGRIEGDGAESLVEALREPGIGGVVEVTVTNVSQITGNAKAVIRNNG